MRIRSNISMGIWFSNAVFVKEIAEVKPVLETLRVAAQNGELDSAIEMTLSKLRNRKN
jgi:hypothetical protein